MREMVSLWPNQLLSVQPKRLTCLQRNNIGLLQPHQLLSVQPKRNCSVCNERKCATKYPVCKQKIILFAMTEIGIRNHTNCALCDHKELCPEHKTMEEANQDTIQKVFRLCDQTPQAAIINTYETPIRKRTIYKDPANQHIRNQHFCDTATNPNCKRSETFNRKPTDEVKWCELPHTILDTSEKHTRTD